MQKKKVFRLVMVAVLVLAVAAGVFAEGRAADSFTFDGTCKKTFRTTGKLILIPNTVSRFRVYLTDITAGYDYAKARPVGPNGEAYSTLETIVLGNSVGTPYILNDQGKEASHVHAQIYNPLYLAGTSSSTPIHIVGRMIAEY